MRPIKTTPKPANETCSSDQEYFYSAGGGRCCTRCGPGTGMVRLCTLTNDTQCGPCKEGVEYSDSASTRDKCLQCTACHSIRRGKVRKNCTTTTDAECECIPGYYLSAGECKPCTKCRPGFGAVSTCSRHNDTVCRPCPNGTFSEGNTATRRCQPCRKCRPGEKEVRACKPSADTFCCAKLPCSTEAKKGRKETVAVAPEERPSDVRRRKGETWHQIAIFNVNEPNNGTRESNSTLGDSSTIKSTPPDPRSRGPTSTDLIPLYCALMSLVIVSLIAYVAFKYWHRRCRAAGGAKALPGGLLSGAGVFQSSGKRKALDPGACEDPEESGMRLMALNSAKYCPIQDGRRCELSSQRLRAVEARLPKDSWRELARALEFSLDDMNRMEAQSISLSQPALRVLLRDFASRPSATGEQLGVALQCCGQQETAALLLSDVMNETEMARV